MSMFYSTRWWLLTKLKALSLVIHYGKPDAFNHCVSIVEAYSYEEALRTQGPKNERLTRELRKLHNI
jgi:hypothetical protein